MVFRHTRARKLWSLLQIVVEHDPIMRIEPAATTTEQIKCQSSSTATIVARPTTILFVCAKRHPWIAVRSLRWDSDT
jgi:hypothetical protein